ncbi:hypothetical protein FK518_27915 [Klebsiella pneumoniae]|nr:hypothetical protein [Klebsiella pneumoniae]
MERAALWVTRLETGRESALSQTLLVFSLKKKKRKQKTNPKLFKNKLLFNSKIILSKSQNGRLLLTG